MESVHLGYYQHKIFSPPVLFYDFVSMCDYMCSHYRVESKKANLKSRLFSRGISWILDNEQFSIKQLNQDFRLCAQLAPLPSRNFDVITRKPT